MRKILIVNYRNLEVGGIENYIYDVTIAALKESYEIIWMCDVNPAVSPIYSDIFDTDRVKKIICNTHSYHWYAHESIDFRNVERIIVLSFDFFNHIKALDMLKKIKCNNIYPIFLMPHFKGGLLFPETNFRFLGKYLKKVIGNLYIKFINDDEMFFMSKDHPIALEKAYKIKVEDSNRIMAPEFHKRRPFNKNNILFNYRRKEFYIVSAGRLEFPHKGYLLGLIDVFQELLGKYNFIKLFIIGDGRDKQVLLDKLEKLPTNIKKNIFYKKSLSFEELLDFYEQCNLSIAVAGCASAGAKIGLLTLPARHYTEKCEVYGFIPESKEMTTSEKPGKPAKDFIEYVINMNENEYLEKSKASYDCYNYIVSSISDLYKNRDIKCYKLNTAELIMMKIIYFLDKANYYLKIL